PRQPKGKVKAESVFEITIFSDGLGERFARGANTLPFALPPQRAKTARRGPRRLRRMGHPAFCKVTAKDTSRSLRDDNQKTCNSNGKENGGLRCAAHDEAVSSFGRDGAFLGWRWEGGSVS